MYVLVVSSSLKMVSRKRKHVPVMEEIKTKTFGNYLKLVNRGFQRIFSETVFLEMISRRCILHLVNFLKLLKTSGINHEGNDNLLVTLFLGSISKKNLFSKISDFLMTSRALATPCK